MKVDNLVEHEDGSATLTVDMTPEEMQLVVEVGLLKLLTDYMEKENAD